jgi:hypothetical protein
MWCQPPTQVLDQHWTLLGNAVIDVLLDLEEYSTGRAAVRLSELHST